MGKTEISTMLKISLDPKFWLWPVTLSAQQRHHEERKVVSSKITITERVIKILERLPQGSLVDVKSLCEYMRLDGYNTAYKSSGKRTPEQMMYLTVYGSLKRAVKEGKLIKVGSKFGCAQI